MKRILKERKSFYSAENIKTYLTLVWEEKKLTGRDFIFFVLVSCVLVALWSYFWPTTRQRTVHNIIMISAVSIPN